MAIPDDVRTFGPFQLIAPLATGGMARADLARVADDPPGRELVIKRIRPEVADDPELRALFVEETRLARQLAHPGIVSTYGAGEHEGELFIALAYVWGEDLRAVARKGLPPLPLVAHAVAGWADALHAAHTQTNSDGEPLELVHRDVSPPNLMVRYDGQPVIVDFGIATVARRHQRVRPGQLKGKFSYMSPEQVSGLPIDRRADVFSLGVVLYEFTVGARLFRRDSSVATMAAVAAADVPDPCAARPGYPAALADVVRRALARDPDARFPSAAALADAIRRAVPPQSDATDALGRWMRDAFTERIAEIAALVGDAEYAGPTGPPDLPWLHVDHTEGEMSDRDDTEKEGVEEAGDRDATEEVAAASGATEEPATDGPEPATDGPDGDDSDATDADATPDDAPAVDAAADAEAADDDTPAKGDAEAPAARVAPSLPSLPSLPTPPPAEAPVDEAPPASPEPEATDADVLDDGDAFDALLREKPASQSAVHDIPDDPSQDPFFQASRGSRSIFFVVGLAVAVMVIWMGYRFASEGLGTSNLDDYEIGPNVEDIDVEPLAPPPALATTSTRVTSSPEGAAIVVNGLFSGHHTPADVVLNNDAINVVSLHLDRHATTFVEARAGAAVDATLSALPAPEVDPAPGEADSAEGSADPGPGPGRGVLVVNATNAGAEQVAATVHVNGEAVGTAPARVEVDAGVRHHVQVTLDGHRPAAAYTRTIEWRDRTSETELNLELPADQGTDRPLTTLRLRASPATAQVEIDGNRVGTIGIHNLSGYEHHVISITAEDHHPLTRSIATGLGQFTVDAFLDPVRTGPAALTLSVEPPETTVFIERLRAGSGGGRQLTTPTSAMEVESGPYRITLERRVDDQRTRARFEVTLEAGVHTTLTYTLVDDAFVAAEPVTAPVE